MKLIAVSTAYIPGRGRYQQYTIEATDDESPRGLAIEFCQVFAIIPIRLMATVPRIEDNSVVICLFDRLQTIKILRAYKKLEQLQAVLSTVLTED